MSTVRFRSIATILIVASAHLTAQAQTNSKEIMAQKPADLVKLLQNPGASVFEKAKACQGLAMVGTADAIPALAALLPDEKLNEYARFGLEGIGDPAVNETLRAATAKLQGRQLIGVIDSIGQRKDTQAVGLLRGLLGNGDAAVASAAAGALGRIGTSESAAVLKEALGNESPVKVWIADGCLACADGLAVAGKKAEAIALYETVGKASVPKHVQAAALGGQMRLQQGEAKDLLLAQIRSQDPVFFNLGLSVARQMPGAEVTAALAAELEKFPPERQALLLRALGDRSEQVPLALIIASSRNGAIAVREVAVRMLARHADPSAAGFVLDAAVSGGEVAAAAKESLKNMPPNPALDAAIAARLAGATPQGKAVLIELVGARRISAALPVVQAALSDTNEPVRLAATMAIGDLIDLNNLDLLIAPALADSKPAEMATARAALKTAAARVADRDACAVKFAERLKGASPANQTYLLELLAVVSGPKALDTVVANAKSSDPATKDVATRVLGEWPDASAAPVLLNIVRHDSDSKYQIRALRGYIRIARQLKLPDKTKLDMFRTAMEVSKRNEEKKLALDILSRIPSSMSLKLAVSSLDQPALKDTAAEVAVKIAAKHIGRSPKAVASAMQKVLDSGVSGNSADAARQLLGQAKAASK